MNSKIVEAEKRISNVCTKHGVSREGAIWLTQVLDPFKDMVRPHPGYPDKIMDPSVVEVVKQTVNVSKPAALGAGDWDTNIFLDQFLFNQNLRSTTVANTGYVRATQGATDYIRGGLVVRSNLSALNNLSTTTTVNANCLQVDPALYANENCRVVGIAFEVHNTTAEIDQQGDVIVWRIPKPDSSDRVVNVVEDANGVTACIPTSLHATVLAQPPIDPSEALDLPGSLQWKAKEGVYTVPILIDEVNPPTDSANKALISIDNGITYFPVIQTGGASRLISCTASNVSNPFSMQGAMFSGLKDTSILTVNVIYFLERFPSKASLIKRLCYPSPDYDTKAFEIYSSIAHKIPVGVMVKENGLGDWISGISKLVATFAPMIPHPIGKVLGGAATFIASASETKTAKNMIRDVEKGLANKEVLRIANEPRVLEVSSRTHGTGSPTLVTVVPNNRVYVAKTKRTNKQNNSNPLDNYIVKGSKNAGNVWVANGSAPTRRQRKRVNG
jgi:hypothetical protein